MVMSFEAGVQEVDPSPSYYDYVAFGTLHLMHLTTDLAFFYFWKFSVPPSIAALSFCFPTK